MKAEELGPWERALNRDWRRDESRSTNTFFLDGTFRKRSRKCKGFRGETYFVGVGKGKGEREQGSQAEEAREGQVVGEETCTNTSGQMPWAELGKLLKS